MKKDTVRIPGPDTRIDVNDSWELKCWAKTLGVSERELRETVERIGPASDAVKDYLHGEPTQA